MNEFLKENSIPLFGEANVIQGEHMAGSTDMGDVAHIIPVIHPWVGCIEAFFTVPITRFPFLK